MWYNRDMEDGFYVLVAFSIGWIVAQALKFVFTARKGRERGIKALMVDVLRSGGMPSGHTASLVAVCTYLLLQRGVFSVEFSLMFCVTLIVIYDAVNVRFAVGEQGKALNRLSQKVEIIEGHTPVQVLVGLIIGVAAGLCVFFLKKNGIF